jgi:aspartyl/asparaginyl beta-hydroxylase (cupin superfamily)
MSQKKKLAFRDRSVRHAFIYINILKTELGLNFDEIAIQLNIDNYRTRDGEKYTAKRVSRIWDKRKVKYRSEAFNHEMLKVPNSQAKLAYIGELRSAANELNVKLHLNPQIKTNVSERERYSNL